MFCSKCGNKIDDDDGFCNQCGARQEPIKAEAINESKSSYNKWIRAFCVIWGTFGLLGSIKSGIPYYIESKLPLVLISEILLIPLTICLILLGLFPEYINTKILIKNKYPEIITGIIIISIIIVAIEPMPSEDWWNYTPNF